jgi:hypothetical protein
VKEVSVIEVEFLHSEHREEHPRHPQGVGLESDVLLPKTIDGILELLFEFVVAFAVVDLEEETSQIKGDVGRRVVLGPGHERLNHRDLR